MNDIKAIKDEYQKILNQRTEMESAALRTTQLKAELEESERKLAEARRDDGTAPPEEIYSRVESAKKEVGIKRIQSTRAAAAASQAEGNYATMIRKLAPSLAECLENLSDARSREIVQGASALFKQDVSDLRAFKELVSSVSVVREPQTIAKSIRFCINVYRERSDTPQDFISHVHRAGSFLGSQED